MNNQSLSEFTAAINNLSRAECEKINADPKAAFGAEHFDYSESQLKLYFDQGLTPEATILAMNEEHEAELAFETAAS